MICRLCPRECGVDRATAVGFCGAGKSVRIAKWMLHPWEEPCICDRNGSGAVFFSGCPLRCVFCQNHTISHQICGEPYSQSQLYDLFLRLEARGACNVNLVTPTPYLHQLIPAIRRAKELGLSIPIVMNSGGYEKTEVLRALEGLIDVYLPDFKFFDPALSKKYADAENYAEICREVIREMQRQTGSPKFFGKRLIRGVIVRHLILPGASRDSLRILDALYEDFGKGGIVLSLLRQYTPMHRASLFPELCRTVTTLEYRRVVNKAASLGFEWIYTQGKDSASETFVPDFTGKSD